MSTFTDSSLPIVLVPEDIIFDEILPRLSGKTLIQFKSVSKSWHSTISSYEFAKSHLNFSFSSANQFIIPNFRTFSFQYLPYDELNNLKDPIHSAPFNFHIKHLTLDVVRVCNGLLCLCYRFPNKNDHALYRFNDHFFFTIYNPATHQCCEIAGPDSRHFSNMDVWFGYVPSVDDYKIVVRFVFANNNYVYSLRTGTWKSLYDLDRVLLKRDVLKYNTTVIDDLLYWSFRFKGFEPIQPEEIVGFNIVTEEVKKFPLMDWVHEYFDIEFFVLDGCLSLYCSSVDPISPISDVWTLKQHDDWSSWEKSIFVHNGSLFFHSVSPTGKFLVAAYEMEYDLNKFKIIDASKDSEEQSQGDACFLHAEMIEDGGFYVESLIWPFGTTDSTEEDPNN